MEEGKKVEDVEQVLNEKDDFEILPKEVEESKENMIEMEDKNKSESKENSSNKIPEVDNRTITQEIINIINKDIYKKYKGENNTLKTLKIKTEENFLGNKTLIGVADLLQVKQIRFDNVETKNFNNLLPEKSLMIKNFQKILAEKEKEKEKRNENEENKIEAEINLEEIIFSNCEIDINFGKMFPLIKKLTLKNCKMPYNIASKLNFNFLTHLILENIGLIDDNFQNLFNQIKSNKNLKNSLKLISLKNNNIGLMDPCKGIDDNKIEEVLGLSNLEIFDLSNNKIYFITNKMINALKQIKLIDLTNNGIVFPSRYTTFLSAGKKMSFLVLLTKNYALLNDHNKSEYVDYVIDTIPKIEYGFSSISLINLYIGKYYDKMKTLNLSKFNNTLIELDISYGNINDNDLKVLLKSNLALFNLKKLNLSKNKLTEKILDILTEKDFENQFNKLKILNLSGNLLHFTQAKNYQNFFEKFKSLKSFIVKHTPFELIINNYTRTIINRHYEKERKKIFETKFTNEDLEIQKIVENDNYLVKNTNVTISLLDTNNFKYVSKIKKYFPAFLERINFETRFYDNK